MSIPQNQRVHSPLDPSDGSKRKTVHFDDTIDNKSINVKNINKSSIYSVDPFNDERDRDFDADEIYTEGENLNDTVADIDEILKLVDQGNAIKEVDEKQVISIIHHLKQAVEKNLELRVKYPNDPLKFMDSEIDLDESIKAQEVLSTEPQFLVHLLNYDIVPTFTELLVHENHDIAIEVVNLVSELIDSDMLVDTTESAEENEIKSAKAFVESLYKNGFFSTLVTFLPRIQETIDETHSKCIYNALNIFENLFDADPKHTERVITENIKLIEFLLQRIQYNVDNTKCIQIYEKPPNIYDNDDITFPVNRHYASELLFTICQYGGEAAKMVIKDTNGIRSMIYSISPYRHVKPKSTEEEEFVINIFLAIGSILLHGKTSALPINLSKIFIENDCEYLHILFTYITNKTIFQPYTVKVIESLLENNHKFCEVFIDCGGIKVLFGQFQANFLINGKKYADYQDDLVERVLTCILYLFLNISDIRYFRLLHKFVENNYEKIDRQIFLFDKYSLKVEKATKELQNNLFMDDVEQRMRKFDYGLFILQQAAFIIALLATSQEAKLVDMVHCILARYDTSIKHVHDILDDCIIYLKDYSQQSESQVQLLHVLSATQEMLR